jgi:membrane-bound inhibitor of C-type lysozyme
VLLFQKTTASGTTYEGDRVVFRSAGGEAQVSWEELELRCRAAQ